MGISYSDILELFLLVLNHPKQILYTAVYKWFQYSKSCDGMWDTKWITGGFPHCSGDSHFTFSSFILTKWLNVMHLSLLSFFMTEADLFLWELCSLCCLFLIESRFCVFLHMIPTGPESGFSVSDRGGCSHPHISTLLAFRAAHSRGGIIPQWHILCAVQGWPRQNMFSQQLFRSEMLRN